MIFEQENKTPQANPSENHIKNNLKKLRSYGNSSFASLTTCKGNYIQVAGGQFTCMLEKRSTDERKHYRAYQLKSSVPFPNGSKLIFSGGEIALNNDEWFSIDQVIEVFISFLLGKDEPDFIMWRVINLDFPSSA